MRTMIPVPHVNCRRLHGEGNAITRISGRAPSTQTGNFFRYGSAGNFRNQDIEKKTGEIIAEGRTPR